MSVYNLVIIRHGQSQWNQENKFTGWQDIDLSDKGIQEALQAGELLKKNQFQYDVAFTSVLKRAIRTLWIILDEMDRMWTPVIKSWRLNERHYGELTGSNKQKIIERYGEEQVRLWRRGYHAKPPSGLSRPPASYKQDPVTEDNRYQEFRNNPALMQNLQKGESLENTQHRVLPFWTNTLAPALQEGAKLLIVAHGNSLRALIKHIEHLNDSAIAAVEVPTGTPIAYELSVKDLKPQKNRVILK